MAGVRTSESLFMVHRWHGLGAGKTVGEPSEEAPAPHNYFASNILARTAFGTNRRRPMRIVGISPRLAA